MLLLSSGHVAASETAAEVLREETVAAHFGALVRVTRGS
jgi:ABC-type hemin transport system ATPase subunit